ncbi:MAG: flavin reductase family protein, partial [Candidatus Marsarchaeota archaeon]|nr:flavin reductase family protein [Candidatus Marsarchaeota archaeon]
MFHRLFYPRQTCMLAATHEDKSNVTVVDWATPVSVKPPMLAVALNLKSYSLELLLASRCFTLSV